MSRFGDLIHGKTTQTPVVETPVVEEPPVVEDAPVVDTAPASVEDPVDPEPLDLWSLSKDELEDYGCSIDIYDPWVDVSELKASHNKEIISNPFESNK